MKRLKRNLYMVIAPAMTAAVMTAACTAVSPAETGSDDTSQVRADTGYFTPADNLFSERDLEQEPDLTQAVYCTVRDNETVTITAEGVYVLRGQAENASVVINAPEDAKVQIVLDNVSVQNSGLPVIQAVEADKVFLTTAAGTVNTLTVSGAMTEDTDADGVIWSRCDLTLNGSGTLTISSSANGIVCLDALCITGGTYNITAEDSAVDANDSIAVYDGTFNLTADNDGLHAENSDDDTLGWIVIEGGSFTIQAGDDAVHGTSFVTFSGGSAQITAREGIEATAITVNDGTIHITAGDDGLNAGYKSDALPVRILIHGGTITIDAQSAETDGVDANGDITVNGGTLTVNAQSAFDYDGTGVINGGTVIVNGNTVTQLAS